MQKTPIKQERFKEIVSECGGAKIFADKFGLSVQMVNNYCSGRNSPCTERLIYIINKLGISADWLFGRRDYPKYLRRDES